MQTKSPTYKKIKCRLTDMGLFLSIFVSALFLISCQEMENYSYDEGKLCLRYKLSNTQDKRTFHFENIDQISCKIKANIEYKKLLNAEEKPYCILEGKTDILNRIECSLSDNHKLVIQYSKCVQDHRLPIVNITIASRYLNEVDFYGLAFTSYDTIISNTNQLDLYLKRKGQGFNIFCDVPLINLRNSVVGESFVLSGKSDSVHTNLESINLNSCLNLRNLQYRVLNCRFYNNYKYSDYPADTSYAGAPEYIYYDLGWRCNRVEYLGNPVLISKGSACDSIVPEL